MRAVRLTPMFEQYLRIKQEHPDALLFYRMGDFYELFFGDAETAARELGLTLTSRSSGGDDRAPMCGVPHHSSASYLAQLLDKGYSVAICEQMEDPRQARGLVKREVTRVLTPGTAVDDESLNAKVSNYLAALLWDEDRQAGALAWADFSTGQWSGIQVRSQELLAQWLAKLGPRELLMAGEAEVPARELTARVVRLPARPAFEPAKAAEAVLAAQGVADLAVLDLADKPELVRCLGAVLHYLRQTRQDTAHMEPFRPLDLGDHLILDEVTERNLELFRRLDGKSGPGTLWAVLDRSCTAMGGRLLTARLRQPWRSLGPMLRTQEAVAAMVADDNLRTALRRGLSQVYDMERLSTRVVLGRATPRDMAALRDSLGLLPGLRRSLAELPEVNRPPLLADILVGWDELADMAALLAKALVDSPPLAVTEGGIIRQGYNPELDEFIELTEHGEARLDALLEAERAAHELPKLKLGYNRVFGYYFELSRAHKGDLPAHFERRQTLAGVERYVTPALKELEDRMLSAAEQRRTLEYRIFQDLREQLTAARPRLAAQAARLAELDVLQSLAETARTLGWNRPELSTDFRLVIRQGRHPVVEQVMGLGGGGQFVPNDLHLDDLSRLLLITGPNMAGKSTVLRQAAIIVILAQMGSFVPAAKAEVGLADRVFCRVGASDNLARGQSTFMVEMLETARILRNSTRKSLVILDEIGRGTSTFDGLALAWAVVEELARRQGGVRTLFATHYHELTSLEGRIAGLRNHTMAITEWKGEIVFLRRLVPGPADKSYGIEVARLAGVPRPVVERAKAILAELEQARDADKARPVRQAAGQSLLPGLTQEVAPPEEVAEHPLLAELRALALDRLTPLEALNLLHRWQVQAVASSAGPSEPATPGDSPKEPS